MIRFEKIFEYLFFHNVRVNHLRNQNYKNEEKWRDSEMKITKKIKELFLKPIVMSIDYMNKS